LLIRAHIIHEHGLRKDGGGVGIPRPAPAHGHIEEQEKGMIENPLLARVEVGAEMRGIEEIVHIEADDTGLPLHGKNVELIGETLSARQGSRSRHAPNAF